MRELPTQPNSNDCNEDKTMRQDAHGLDFATFGYPQMGGYVGRSLVRIGGYGSCFDVMIWHDGEFPFDDDGRPPTDLHHCCAVQFLRFGLTVIEKQLESGAPLDHNADHDLELLREQVERANAILARAETAVTAGKARP